MTDEAVVITCDGATENNGQPGARGGWGAVVRHPDRVELLSGPLAPPATNQRAELTAAVEALSALPGSRAVRLRSDSQYVIKGMTEWLSGWQRRGWRNAQGQTVANQDLWLALVAAAKPHRVCWEWVRGHNGDPDNEQADRLAVAAIARARGPVRPPPSR
jgi:ribonuclease HI